jgi:hypothetical protein
MKAFSMRVITVIIAGIVVHLFMAIGFVNCRGKARTTSQDTVSELHKQWESDDITRGRQFEEELKTKFGTDKLDQIAYDPRLDMPLALEKLFKAVSPGTGTSTKVTVDIDRFTEFTVTLAVIKMPSRTDAAAMMKAVFTRVDPNQVYRIIFTDGDSYLLSDRAQFLRVTDWKNATLDDIAKKAFF